MKNTAMIIAFAILFFTTEMHAQAFSGIRFLGGATAANQSWKYSFIPQWSTDNRWAFVGIASVDVIDLDVVHIVAEVQYSQKGMTQSIPITSESDPEGTTGRFIVLSPRIDYLSIPLLIQIPISFDSFTPFVLVGPRMDFVLFKKGDGLDVVVDRFRNSEYGLTFGVGLQLHSPLAFDVVGEFRYEVSLQDAYSTDFLKVRNRAFGILLGVQL